MNRTLRCSHCDDVIGVYEPMIVLSDGQARETSRAAEPDAHSAASACYHRDCHARLHGEDGPAVTSAQLA